MDYKKNLIINADDFGIHQYVNKAIIEGHNLGVITSTSIIAQGNAFDNAVFLAKFCPNLKIGIHLTLVGEKLLEKSTKGSSLLSSNANKLRNGHTEFIKDYLFGKIKLIDIKRELKAQVQKVLDSDIGSNITHFDSHQHLHVLPGIVDIIIDLALEFNIKKVRVPSESIFFFGDYKANIGRIVGRTGLSCLAMLARRKFKMAGISSPDNFFGMLAGGNLREELLSNIIDKLPNGVSEVMVHPGFDDIILGKTFNWKYNWESEFQALKSRKIKEKIQNGRINLISFAELNN